MAWFGTPKPQWAEMIKILRFHGIDKDAWKRYTKDGSWFYEVVDAGYKYNMTDVQAGLGLAQLKKIDWMLTKRKEIARIYTEAFSSRQEIMTPVVKPDRETAWHLYPIKLNLTMLTMTRDECIEHLSKSGIGTGVHFIPLYRHPYYKNNFNYHPKDFPNSEWIFERVISLPIYPDLADNEIKRIIEVLLRLIEKHKK